MILVAGAVVIFILASLWIYARWEYGTLEKMGIPVVEYTNPILGSTPDLYRYPGGPRDVQWTKKYGKIFGFYDGCTPMIMIGVPELVRLICVKDFHHFEERRTWDLGDSVLNEFPDFTPAEKWKVIRTLYTSVFSPAKLKMMNMPMKEAALDFTADIKEKIRNGNGTHEKMAINHGVLLVLIDLICRSLFSIQIKDRYSMDNEWAKIAQDLIILDEQDSLAQKIVMYTHAFPFIRRFLPYSVFNPKPAHQFSQIFKGLLDERRISGEKRNDLIDACLEWWDRLDSAEFKENKITESTLYMQALTFFAGGLDPISTMVGGLIYHMTQDPSLEQLIYDEVDDAFKKGNGELGHEQLAQLQVIHACLLECRRLYPSFHRGERICTKDWRNDEYNLTIKKGTVIQIPIWVMNRDPEYNPNPDKFDHTRFMPGNKEKLNAFASTSHGYGYRECRGRPFAQEAMPLILAYLLKEFRFIGRKDTEMKPAIGGFFFTPFSEIFVDVVERNKNNND